MSRQAEICTEVWSESEEGIIPSYTMHYVQFALAIWPNVMKHNQNTSNATYITLLFYCQKVCALRMTHAELVKTRAFLLKISRPSRCSILNPGHAREVHRTIFSLITIDEMTLILQVPL